MANLNPSEATVPGSDINLASGALNIFANRPLKKKKKLSSYQISMILASYSYCMKLSFLHYEGNNVHFVVLLKSYNEDSSKFQIVKKW